MKKNLLFALGLAALFCLPSNAQEITLKGIGHNNRYDDGEQMKSTWIGSLYDENGKYTGKTAFIVDQGIYSMSWDGMDMTDPVKDPAVNIEDIKQGGKVDYEKALWATNFNLMYGNSGALYIDGQLVTVMSRDESSTTDEELFAVRRWDAKTGNLLSSEIYPKSAFLESAGMSYNPKDGKVYGLFYITEAALPEEITSDPDYFTDQDDQDFGREGQDAGYCLCTIDLSTMKVTPITPGLYYLNFITFAINSEGRAFALTSGGSSAPASEEDGRQYDIDMKLTGAQLCEFDLKTGIMIKNAVQKTDSETGETYTDYEYPVGATGYSSQYRRQSACFSKNNPNIMYWNGYYNSGKGINGYGSWGNLPDSEWKTNHKYDTCLYQVDITTGVATRLSTIPNRWTFSALWVDGDDNSDGSGYLTAIDQLNNSDQANGTTQIFNMQGQQVQQQGRGLYIVKQGNKARKVLNR